MSSQGPQLGTVRYPRTETPIALTALQVAGAYNFPLTKATGRGYVAGFIELGGGYDPSDMASYFSGAKLPLPSFADINVNSGSNQPGGPADAEVQSDMIVAGTIAPDAQFRVYFTDNSNDGYLAALEQAFTECNGVSTSWGAPESGWPPSTMQAIEEVIDGGRRRGVPLFAAAGDTGADDGTGIPTVDFPASSPSAIGCGGTRLLINPDGTRLAETVWDDSPYSSATGGGVSQVFPGRQVPDIAGNADPDTGYTLAINGQPAVIGGTSLVAPMMLGLHALLWEMRNGGGFDFLTLIAAHPGVCFDVTIGNNGAYRAGPGRDDDTGFGVPDGGRLAQLITTGSVVQPGRVSLP